MSYVEVKLFASESEVCEEEFGSKSNIFTREYIHIITTIFEYIFSKTSHPKLQFTVIESHPKLLSNR